MPRRVNRRKKQNCKLSPQPPSPSPSPCCSPLPSPSPPPDESLIRKFFINTKYLLKQYPYVVFIVPLMYDFYNVYKKENTVNVNV